MSNTLTGDFDVVAQFAIPAANRVLAAMHRTERFPHSLAMRVDDTRRPGLDDAHPSTVGAVDTFGDPVTNHQRIGRPMAVAGLSASANAAYLGLDPVVNVSGLLLEEVPIEPSNLQGRAQMQIFPPTIEIPDNSGMNVTVKLEMLARYFPDPNTSPVAEFVRGDLRVTAPVTQVASQVANVVSIDIKGATVGIDFTTKWSSRPLIAEDILAINLLIRNALRTSFVPSSSALPAGIAHMQFRTLGGATKAIGVLLNIEGAAGNRASATNVFLGADDFAFGVSSDYVHAAFQPTLDKILSTPVDPVSFKLNGVIHTWNITYTFTLNAATVELKEGEIVLTVQGHAHTGSWTPDFDFTAKLSFSLEVNGDNVDLVPGGVSIDTSSWIINRFRGSAEDGLRSVRNGALAGSGAREAIRRMLSAERNLGGLIDSLLQPARKGNAPPLPKGFSLAYTSADIHTSGIVLHGSLALTDWPVPHVEFEQIPMDGGGRFGADVTSVDQGPDYSALKAWIPGGTIDRFEWKPQGQTQPGFTDENRFVFLHQGPQVSTGFAAIVPLSGFTPLCLTVHGSRLSSAGNAVAQQVAGTICGLHSFPVPGNFGALEDRNLTIALTQPDSGGGVEVGGYTSAYAAGPGRVAPNMIVHFGDRRSDAALDIIIKALSESGRRDASTAVLAVLSHDDLANIRFTAGVTYAEDHDGAWARRFKVELTRLPVTLIVSPGGSVAYRHDGAIDGNRMAAELRKSLVAGGKIEATLKPLSLRIGQLPPNFLFEYAPGEHVTLRKISGRPACLVFWRSSSRQSVDLIQHLKKIEHGAGKGELLVLAINDGETAELARKTAAGNKLPAVIVPDPDRQISLAYGVNAWPTTVWIDTLGITRDVRIGTLGGDESVSPFRGVDAGRHTSETQQGRART